MNISAVSTGQYTPDTLSHQRTCARAAVTKADRSGCSLQGDGRSCYCPQFTGFEF